VIGSTVSAVARETGATPAPIEISCFHVLSSMGQTSFHLCAFWVPLYHNLFTNAPSSSSPESIDHIGLTQKLDCFSIYGPFESLCASTSLSSAPSRIPQLSVRDSSRQLQGYTRMHGGVCSALQIIHHIGYKGL